MSDINKFKDHFIVLLEAGFIAVNQADEDAATKLFKAAELLNPESSLPKIGMGYLHFHKLELKQACKLFEDVIEQEPDNEMARTFLGMSLSLTPDFGAQGEKILAEVAEKASASEVKEVASTTLDFVDKFVKKSPTPMEMHKPKKK